MTTVAGTAAFWAGGRGLEDLTAAMSLAGDPPVGARVPDDVLAAAVTMKGVRPLSRTARLALVVAVDAWPAGVLPGERDAVVLATRNACVEPLAEFVRQAATAGPSMVFPMSFPNTVASVHAGYLAILLGMTGPNITLCGERAGWDALARGLALIEADRADRVLVIAAEAAEPTVNAGAPDTSDCAAAVLLERGLSAPVSDVLDAWLSGGEPESIASTCAAVRGVVGDGGVAVDLMAVALTLQDAAASVGPAAESTAR